MTNARYQRDIPIKSYPKVFLHLLQLFLFRFLWSVTLAFIRVLLKLRVSLRSQKRSGVLHLSSTRMNNWTFFVRTFFALWSILLSYSYLTEQTCMILRLIDDLEEKLDSFILFKTFILFQNLVWTLVASRLKENIFIKLSFSDHKLYGRLHHHSLHWWNSQGSEWMSLHPHSDSLDQSSLGPSPIPHLSSKFQSKSGQLIIQRPNQQFYLMWAASLPAQSFPRRI